MQDSEIERLASAELLRAARRLHEQGRGLDAASLAEGTEAPELKSLITELSFMDDGLAGSADPAECLRELRLRPLEERLGELRRKIASLSGEAQDEALREVGRLRSEIAEIQRAEVAGNAVAGPAV
jgi:hypothetical protein